jgi:hypothetical protein
MRVPPRLGGVALTGSLLASAACAAHAPQAAGTGRITVGVTTTGPDVADLSFEVAIEPAGAGGRIEADAGVFSIASVPAGEHVVRLRDLPARCRVEGGPERTVRVTATRSATVRFEVRCAAGLRL